jgi:streptogramin lyase
MWLDDDPMETGDFNARCGRLVRTALGALALGLMLAGLSGCGGADSGTATSQASTPQQSVGVHGQVHGGQRAIVGATISLYAAGSIGDGSGAVSLLGIDVVTTDSAGAFSVPASYVCPSAGAQVYLVARGGSAGGASVESNAALVMMAALGRCGDVTSATDVVVNEVTTVGSAWALAEFMSAGGDVGATATNAVGLSNAFAVAKNLADVSTGTAPGAALPVGAVVETAKLNTLANALTPCVVSSGGTGCGALLGAAIVGGVTPANTLDAALNIVTHPGSNVAAVFGAAAGAGTYAPALGAAPNDWTMSITYGGCVPAACGGLNLPGAVAIDSGGNVVVANYFGGAMSKFSATGVPAAAAGYAGVGLRESFGIAVDGADDVWVANEQSVTAANNSHHGSVSEFSSAGVELSGNGYTGGGLYFPVALAVDAGGDVWAADYGSSSATLLAQDGSAISGASGYGVSALPFTSAVAIDASHNAWFAVQNAAVRVSSAGAVTSFACCNDPAGIAIDAGGDVWIADYNGSAVVELTSAGAVEHTVSVLGGDGGPKGIAVDGAGNVWAANYYGNALVEIAGATAGVASPAQGYGVDAGLHEPYGLAVDASGSVWVSNSATNTLTQFVGLASPVKTPLLGPPVKP